MTSIYEDDAVVADVTRRALEETGSRLLQIHRFSDDDAQHVKRLLKIFDPPQMAVIADVGCGVGRLAELMKAQRPDLNFVLVNPSASQLDMCSESFVKLYGRAEDIPIAASGVDAIMVTYALGHFDLERFVKECRRVEVSYVYVFDLFKLDVSEFKRSFEKDLHYEERTMTETIQAFADGGFNLTRLETTNYVPPAVQNILPSWDTLIAAVSAAMVFENE